MILSILYLVAGLGGIALTVGVSYFVSRALRVRGIEAVVEGANSTIQLYDSRIKVLEDSLIEMKSKYEEMLVRNKYLEELVLQRADMKLVHTKLNRLLKMEADHE